MNLAQRWLFRKMHGKCSTKKGPPKVKRKGTSPLVCDAKELGPCTHGPRGGQTKDKGQAGRCSPPAELHLMCGQEVLTGPDSPTAIAIQNTAWATEYSNLNVCHYFLSQGSGQGEMRIIHSTTAQERPCTILTMAHCPALALGGRSLSQLTHGPAHTRPPCNDCQNLLKLDT